ncbi:MAG: PPC domain-containing DNA-binding protein [Thermodesulfobacteriota bacterium]
MEYRTGNIGRVIMARFDHGDDLLEGLSELVRKEQIDSGWFQILGGLRQAGVVIGPKEPTMPPEPIWHEVEGAREVIGSGTVFWDSDEPRIHLHAAMGDHGETTTACVRKNTKIYLILEVVLFEIEGLDASRPWFDKGQFFKLQFGGKHG